MKRTLSFITLIALSLSAFSQVYSWGLSFGGNLTEVNGGLEVDNNDQVFQFGHFSGSADFDPGNGVASFTASGSSDLFISKFASDGSWLWTKTFGGSGVDEANDMAIDQDGNLILFGIFQTTVDFDPGVGIHELTSNGSRDCFVVKLSNNGDYIWVGTFGGSSAEVSEHITTDFNNDIIFTGKFLNLVDFDPSAASQTIDAGPSFYSRYFVKWTSAGNFQWASSLFDTDVQVNDMLADAAGNIYFAGNFTGTSDVFPGPTTYQLLTSSPTAFESDGFIMMMNSEGSPVWATDYGNQVSDYIYAIALNSSGDIIVGGDMEDATVMKVNPVNGSIIWSQLLGGRVYDLSLDSNENIYLASTFYTVEDFDPSPFVVSYNPSGSNTALIVKLSNSGNYIWSGTFVSSVDSKALETDLLSNDEIVVSGVYDGDIDLDASDLDAGYTAAGSTDIYLMKLVPCAAPSQEANIVGDFTPCIPDTISYTLVTSDETNTASWISSLQNSNFLYDDSLANDIFIPNTQTNTIRARAYNSCGVGPIAEAIITPNANPNISIIATPNDTICSDNAVKLHASVTSSLSYSWSDGITDNEYFEPTESGFYTVTALGFGDCNSSDSIYVFVVPPFDVAVQIEPDELYHCEGNAISFTASGADSYTYSEGVIDGQPFIPQSELYQVTGYVGECIATSFVSIDIIPLPILEVILTPSGPVCAGESVNILVTGADTYVFEPSHVNGLDVSLTETTNYTVNGSSAGCGVDLDFTVEIIPQPSFISQPSDQTTISGNPVNFTVSASDAITYTWQVNTGTGFTNITAGSQYSNPNTATLTVLNPSTAMNGYDYRCIISNNGCDDTSTSANLTVNINNGVIESSLMDNAVKVFPNPTMGDCEVIIDERLLGRFLKIYDITGNCVQETLIQSTNIALLSSGWSAGLYYLSVQGMSHPVKLQITR